MVATGLLLKLLKRKLQKVKSPKRSSENAQRVGEELQADATKVSQGADYIAGFPSNGIRYRHLTSHTRLFQLSIVKERPFMVVRELQGGDGAAFKR